MVVYGKPSITRFTNQCYATLLGYGNTKISRDDLGNKKRKLSYYWGLYVIIAFRVKVPCTDILLRHGILFVVKNNSFILRA